jgi:hypothetical protein
VASAAEPWQPPSGSRQGFGAIVGGRACSWRRLDCHRGVGASAPAPAGRFHLAMTGASAPVRAVCSMTWGSASADRSIIALKPLPRTPVPALRGRAPGHRDLADGAPRSTARLVPPGTGSSALFGGRVAQFHRDTATGALRSTAHGLTETGNRTSSEDRPPISTWSEPTASLAGPRPTGARQPALFGAPRARPRGARQPALFGAPLARFHRDREPEALRSCGPPIPSGQGTRTSSEARRPPSHRARTSPRDGPPPLGQSNRRSSEHRAPLPHRTGNPELFGARAPRSHRAREPGPPRRPGTPNPVGQGPPVSPPATGALRSPARQAAGRYPGPPRRPGPPIPRESGHPAPRGRATGSRRQGIPGVRPPPRRVTVGTDTDLGRYPSRAGR